MRFIQYAIRETEGTDTYVAFGEAAFFMPVYKVTPKGLVAMEIKRERFSPIPIVYPSVFKFVYPIRVSRERRMSLQTILDTFGEVFDEQGEKRDYIWTRTPDKPNAERRFIS